MTEICIIGAGPAGAAAALQFAALGKACTVIDSAVFPRDKVCGDGLSGKVLTTLNRIDTKLAEKFLAFTNKQASRGVDFVSPGRYTMHIPYKVNYSAADAPTGFVCRRLDFDNFLVDQIKESSLITLIENTRITKLNRVRGGFEIYDNAGATVLTCRLLIIANGANSGIARELTGMRRDERYLGAGVRAYFNDVSGMHHDHFIELHFLQKLLPGYFWIFPLPGGMANVGLDMLSADVRRHKINLRKLLTDTIGTEPGLAERFSAATMVSAPEGYTLPLAGRSQKYSGEHFMIAGDAASMIDPLTGEGIGNAMYAGRLAALQGTKALQDNDFTASKLSGYDDTVQRVLGSEFRLSHRLQRLATNRRLFDWLMKRGASSTKLQSMVSGMLYDISLRKKLATPGFYFDLLFKK